MSRLTKSKLRSWESLQKAEKPLRLPKISNKLHKKQI